MVAAVAIILLALSPLIGDVESEAGRRNSFGGPERSNVSDHETHGKYSRNGRGYNGDHDNRASDSYQKHIDHDESRDNHDDLGIAGYMTLKEVEEVTQVPTVYILSTLELSNNTPVDERLGRLKREYKFEMEDVKNAVRRYWDENP
jgi:hypothetical protein